MTVRQVLKENSWFLLSWLPAFAAGAIAIAVFAREELHLAVNSIHLPAGDYFFRYLTWLGSGWAALMVAVILLFGKIRYFLFVFTSVTASGLVTQLMKHLVFPGAMRPVEYLAGYELHLVQGVKMLHRFSFPSGHATCAFAVLFVLAYLLPSRTGKILCGIMAILIAYSRVYLSQHFISDIFAGSVIGIVFAALSIWIISKIKAGWSDKALLSLVFKSGSNEE